MIYFNNVTKAYDVDSISLEGVSFSVTEGEFVSVVGHSGAGKTTLVKLILGEEQPTEGTVFFESIDIHALRSRELTRLRKRIGVVFQDFRLLPSRTAYENIAFAMEAAQKSDQEIREDVPHVLDLVDMEDKQRHFPHQLSGGEKQRLAIARAIINEPEVLVADEPTGNLDPVNTYEVVQILKKINELGTTVMLTTHNRGVIDSVGKRVITIDKGRVIRDDADGTYIM